MNARFVHDSDPVLLVGGGKHRKRGFEQGRPFVRKIVAADSGADWLVKHDITPEMVIGDFDSISPKVRFKLGPSRALLVNEQDTTDFEKCLSRIEAPLVIGVGFVGGRVDHQLASYHGLIRHADTRCILVGPQDLAFLAPRKLEIELPVGSRFSLFPFGAMHAQSQGLVWPVDAVDFAPGQEIGTSNEVSGPVVLQCDAPKMLVILPLSALAAAVGALDGAGEPWPARKEA